MICYGLMDPPEPPYILILMSSIQGVAFNVLWVRTLRPSIDLHLIFILTTSVDNLMMIRPVHKNLFLEFPKYPGRFMLHFDI